MRIRHGRRLRGSLVVAAMIVSACAEVPTEPAPTPQPEPTAICTVLPAPAVAFLSEVLRRDEGYMELVNPRAVRSFDHSALWYVAAQLPVGATDEEPAIGLWAMSDPRGGPGVALGAEPSFFAQAVNEAAARATRLEAVLDSRAGDHGRAEAIACVEAVG